ncbi:uncharacterized [Lates japonicus]
MAILQVVAEVVELCLGQCQGWTQNHLMPQGRQVGFQSHIDPHSTETQQDGHLDEALCEVFLQVQHGVGISEDIQRSQQVGPCTQKDPGFSSVPSTMSVSSAVVSLGKVKRPYKHCFV